MKISDLFESENTAITVYHGSNADFSEFDQRKARIPNDFYGGGVAYFTDSSKIAEGYARTMTRQYGGTPTVYTVKLNLGLLFDIDDTFKGDDLLNFVNRTSSVDEFLRGAKLLPLGADRYKVMSDLKSGKMELTGEQVFKGLSNGMIKTGQARKILEKMGYDTLRYNGGLMMKQGHHSVYLAYHANNIDIISKRHI